MRLLRPQNAERKETFPFQQTTLTPTQTEKLFSSEGFFDLDWVPQAAQECEYRFDQI